MTTSVANTLERYAQRGVFRSFSQAGAEFRFHWLWNLPFRLTLDARTGTIVFPALLSGVTRGSELELSLKDFIRESCSSLRPEHRRIDPARLAIFYSNRSGFVNLKLRSRDRDYSYAATQAIRLVNEIFLEFLQIRYPEHLCVSSD